jgi:putative membrane protein insertion efficiency factor
MTCPSAPINQRNDAAHGFTGFVPVCPPRTDEGFFSDAEQRAEPVSPSNEPSTTRQTAEASRRLRPRVPAWAAQQRPSAGRALHSQRSPSTELRTGPSSGHRTDSIHPLRLRHPQTSGQCSGAQQGEASAAGDTATAAAARGFRPGDLGATGGGRSEFLRLENGVDDAAEARASAGRTGLAVRAALLVIRFYQRAVSPGLGRVCRFEPSCSHYTYEAIERHGLLRGVLLGVRRLLRCRPFGGSGYDPIPE